MEISLGYNPFDYQLDLHIDSSRFRIIAGGRRVGKTKCCTQEIIKHCLSEPNRLAFWVAPTYRDAREVGFEEFMAHSDVLAPAIHKIHLTTLKVEFVNGSVIYYKGSDNPDSLRGRGLSFLVCDEFAFFRPGVFNTVLRPALSDKSGRAILISTPNGYNEFYDYMSKENSWSKYHWTTDMNPLIAGTELEEVKAEISDIDYRQEYLAEFITRAGRVYDDFNEENHDPTFLFDRDKHDVYLGMDFGYATKTAIVFVAVDRGTDNRVCIFDEIYVTRKQIDTIAELIDIKLRDHGISRDELKATYTDPAGNAEELSSGKSPVDMLRSHGFKVINKGTNIVPGLELVRSFVKNVRGERRLLVHPRCEETIKSFRGYQYVSNAQGLTKEEALKDGVYDHLMDATRYFFVNRFDKAKYVAKTLESCAFSAQLPTKVMKKCDKCNRPFVSNTPKTQPPHICGACTTK